MSFKDRIKVDPSEMEKTLLIVEDNVKGKLRYFFDYLNNNEENLQFKYRVFDNLDDAWDFYIKNIEQIDIVVLDCAVPRKPHTDVAFYAGLEIMPRIINRNINISIIFNTPARIQYEGLNPNNVIYLSKNRSILSDIMERKIKKDSRLHVVFDALKRNNSQIHRGMQTQVVLSSNSNKKHKTH